MRVHVNNNCVYTDINVTAGNATIDLRLPTHSVAPNIFINRDDK